MYNSKTNFKMNDKNKAPFKVEDVNWDELSGIGILKDELEQAGELETLLRGEKTGVVSLSLVLLGVDVVMDATLQLVRKKTLRCSKSSVSTPRSNTIPLLT